MRFAVLSVVVMLSVVSAAPPPSAAVEAMDETERDVLMRLDNELGVLERLVYEAERRARSGDRAVFDYRALRSDLAGMRAGVRAYVTDVRPQPSTVLPLQQSYVRAVR